MPRKAVSHKCKSLTVLQERPNIFDRIREVKEGFRFGLFCNNPGLNNSASNSNSFDDDNSNSTISFGINANATAASIAIMRLNLTRETTDESVTGSSSPPPPPPPLQTARQQQQQQMSSILRPPLASSQSTATTKFNHRSTVGAASNTLLQKPPQTVRARLDSSATNSSRHRRQAHESFSFSDASLQSIHNIRNTTTSTNTASQQHLPPPAFVELSSIQRVCSDMRSASFDYSASSRDNDNDDDNEDDARDTSPTTVAIPEWMQSWAKSNANSVGDLPTQPTTDKAKSEADTQKAAAADISISISNYETCKSITSTTTSRSEEWDETFAYLSAAPPTTANETANIFSAYMMASLNNEHIALTRDNLAIVTITDQGQLVVQFQRDNEASCFSVDLAETEISTTTTSMSMGCAVSVRDKTNQSMVLCVLLPVNLPRICLRQWDQYAHLLVAPFGRDKQEVDAMWDAAYAPHQQHEATMYLRFLMDAKSKRTTTTQIVVGLTK
jgi:hypothetical protein